LILKDISIQTGFDNNNKEVMYYIKSFLLFLIISIFWCSTVFSAELYGQVFKRNGSPASNISVIIKTDGTVIERISTSQSGYYSKDLSKGVYTVEVDGISRRIFLSSEGSRVDFRISR